MTTVAKLNYANLRNKSKSKQNDQSEQKQDSGKSDLFSHMNKDNLNYIQSQIKQKNKKKKDHDKIEDEDDVDPYPHTIAEKQSKLEETQRDKQDNGSVSEEIVAKTEEEQEILSVVRKSEDVQTCKLSYYDLISQAKSKRVSSIEGYVDEELKENLKQDHFLNFLDHYVSDLNKKEEFKNQKSLERQNNKQKTGEGRDIFLKIVNEEKKKNIILSRQIEKYRQAEQSNRNRIEALENIVGLFSQQIELLKKDFRTDRDSHRPMNMTMDFRKEQNRKSRNSPQPTYIDSRFGGRNNSEILQLEKELRHFEETGEF